jgi:hypothetical protein
MNTEGLRKITEYVNKVTEPKTKRTLSNLIGHFMGTSVPASGSTGYMPGATFNLLGCVLGQCPNWVNIGTETSCTFVPFGPVYGYGFMYGGIKDATSGSTTDTVLDGLIEYNDIPYVVYYASDDDNACQAYTTSGKSYLTLKNSADPLDAHDYQYAVLRNNCVPTLDIFAAGTRVAVAGDTTSVAITVTGVQAGDIALVTTVDSNDDDYIKAAVCSADTLTLTVSADPVTDHTWDYVILRPRGTFKPSHYVAYAGQHTTTADGDGDNAITITGAVATDITVCTYGTSNDNDVISEAALTANTLTVNMSADPSTAHVLNYAILRAY